MRYDEAYVWFWMPGAVKPVVAGRLARYGERFVFNYGRGYLARGDAVPLYIPELPLEPGELPLPPGLSMPSAIRDAAPDAWGRRVIVNRRFGLKRDDIDIGQLDELTYLLDSGSDRIGALDFQASATDYVPREARAASLEELLTSAERVEDGQPITPELDLALFHGSSLGGARPKAMIEERTSKSTAKFSSPSRALCALGLQHSLRQYRRPCPQSRGLLGRQVAQPDARLRHLSAGTNWERGEPGHGDHGAGSPKPAKHMSYGGAYVSASRGRGTAPDRTADFHDRRPVDHGL